MTTLNGRGFKPINYTPLKPGESLPPDVAEGAYVARIVKGTAGVTGKEDAKINWQLTPRSPHTDDVKPGDEKACDGKQHLFTMSMFRDDEDTSRGARWAREQWRDFLTATQIDPDILSGGINSLDDLQPVIDEATGKDVIVYVRHEERKDEGGQKTGEFEARVYFTPPRGWGKEQASEGAEQEAAPAPAARKPAPAKPATKPATKPAVKNGRRN